MDALSFALDVISKVVLQKYFFGCTHTKQLFRVAFYEPLFSDRINYET